MDEFVKSQPVGDAAPANEALASAPEDSISSRVLFASAETSLFNPANETQPYPISIQTAEYLFMDRYLIKGEIGRGGFGRVLAAQDQRLERPVAIKVARRAAAVGSSLAAEFQREARLAAKINHPNVVTVYDSGVDDAGQCFVAFEFVAGQTLADRIQAGPIDRIQAVTWMITIAEAVHAAHKLQLVHRDLKPANILLDEEGRLRVADFGLAMTADSRQERAGEIAGSPPYMAPEQLRGETEHFDCRTDIWGLGVILFELLVGRRPFAVEDSKDTVGLIARILDHQPTRLREVDGTLPMELDEICQRCLAKDMSDRWKSAEEFAQALRSVLATLTTQPAVSTPTRTSSTRWLIALAIIMGLTATPAFNLGWMRNPQIDQQDLIVPAANQQVPPIDVKPAEPKLLEPIVAETPEPVASPVPGKWFPLLARRPQEVFWPADAGLSYLDFSKETKQLRFQCNQDGILKLGEASGDYEVKVDLSQPNWIGSMGLVLGLREDVMDGLPAMSFQTLVVLSRTTGLGKSDATLQRGRGTRVLTPSQVPPNGTRSRYANLTGTKLKPWFREATLRVRVESGRLTSVAWNHEEHSELCTPELDEWLKPEDYQGGIGLYIQQASGVVSNAELLLQDEEAQ